jgi:hypothetical protein
MSEPAGADRALIAKYDSLHKKEVPDPARGKLRPGAGTIDASGLADESLKAAARTGQMSLAETRVLLVEDDSGTRAAVAQLL